MTARIMRLGDHGADVTLLQDQLNKAGYPCGAADGDFGPKTKAALRRFHLAMGTSGSDLVGGVAGPVTMDQLAAVCRGIDHTVQQIARPTTFLGMFLQVAKEELSKKVREIGGKNCGPDVEKYLRSVRLGKGYAWCAAFVYWCAVEGCRRLGIDNPLIRGAGCLDLAEQYQDRGWIVPKGQPALPGDLVIWDKGNGNGHIGIVIAANGDALKTIEGNTNKAGSREGDGVYEKDRSLELVSYVVRIAA